MRDCLGLHTMAIIIIGAPPVGVIAAAALPALWGWIAGPVKFIIV
jgi:hypothetical protein